MQLAKAVRALIAHIKSSQAARTARSHKPDLLARDPDDAEQDDDSIISLLITTKTHNQGRNRLKPSKMSFSRYLLVKPRHDGFDANASLARPVPHSLHSSPSSTICLITVDNNQGILDAIAHASFPAPLRSRITLVIGISKLRGQCKTFESRRQLRDEHDVFLADDRVITQLPEALGKVFYKTARKRPVSVVISGPRLRGSAKNKKKRALSSPLVAQPAARAAKPLEMAEHISRTLSSVFVSLSPSTSSAIRVARSTWTDAMVVENILAVVEGLLGNLITKQWSNIRSFHIRGPKTASLPFYLAEELWVDDSQILSKELVAKQELDAITASKGKGRKRARGKEDEKNIKSSTADDLDEELDRRIQMVKRQKREALDDFVGEGSSVTLE
ncbi:MAG: Ribosomal L1 domain-containing protein 1 [Phylliscum demangeonii]|nr:MAG: Ribosomal L1 domain-containing protein 1 [Phylliscum demangeonii]